MKLLVTTDFPPMVGGIARWAFELYKELKKREDIKVIIKRNSFGNLTHSDFIYYSTSKDLKDILNRFKARVDIVIFFHMDCALPLFLWCKIRKIRYIVVLHGSEFIRGRSLYTELKKNLMLNLSEEIWVTSEYMKDILTKRKIKQRKIRIKEILIDKKKFKKFSKGKIMELRKRYKLTRKKIILTVARLTPVKDFFTVLKAIEILKKKIPNIIYLIVGEGELYDELIKYIKAHRLNRYVKLLGRVSDTQLVELYNICDAFVLTSKEIKEKGATEGFGIVYLEAASCGKPIIGTDTGGIKYALSKVKNSHLISPGDYKTLTRVLLQIL